MDAFSVELDLLLALRKLDYHLSSVLAESLYESPLMFVDRPFLGVKWSTENDA